MLSDNSRKRVKTLINEDVCVSSTTGVHITIYRQVFNVSRSYDDEWRGSKLMWGKVTLYHKEKGMEIWWIECAEMYRSS